MQYFKLSSTTSLFVSHYFKSTVTSASSLSYWLYCIVAIIILSTPLANCDKLNSSSTLELKVHTVELTQDYSYALHRLPNGIKNSSDIYKNNNNNNNNNNKITDDNKSNNKQHMNAYALPAVYTPQQFYNNNNDKPTDIFMPKDELLSFNLVTGLREDLCKNHCHCEAKNKFIAIHCDYEKNQKLSRIFDGNFRVPPEATSISIKLAKRTQFELRRGFFNENRINSITIEGTYSDKEQVELTSEALLGNNGGYPEIIFNNVFSVVIRKGAFGGGDVKFTVKNSNDVILYRDAFSKTNINGMFNGINDLRIEEKAFNSENAKLHIENTHIDNIYRFEASLREIRFVNSSIGTINGGTFDVNTVNSIIFERCRINAIKARAITDKLMSNHVSITDAVIGYIEKEAIYGSGITELILTKNEIDKIDEDAISVTAVSATIADNSIKRLGKNWLRIKEWSNISVKRNRFGEFDAMLLEDPKHPASCIFDSNSINRPAPGSLNYTNCRIHQISVDIPCSCNITWLEQLSNHDLRSELYCSIDEKLAYCFDTSSLNVLKYLNEVCDEHKTTLNCRRNHTLQKVNGNFFTKEELEQNDQRMPLYVFIAVGIAILSTLVVITLIVACRFCKSPTKQMNNATRAGAGGSYLSNHLHEFSATDRNVIGHALELMQKKYPEIYKPVNERCQLLLQPNSNEKKCVKTISQIINYLNQVENSTDDLIAFNRVLTKHLQPQLPTAPPVDPIYTEPGISSVEDGFYTSSAVVGIPTHDYISVQNISDTNVAPEHIYAEPSCAQQPLLRNEYASPADRNLDTMDLYTEPVTDRETNSYPVNYQQQSQMPPYAIPNRPQAILPTNLSTIMHQPGPSARNNDDMLKPQADFLTKLPKYSFQMSTFNPTTAATSAGAGAGAGASGSGSAGAVSAAAIYTTPNLSHKQQAKAQQTFDATAHDAWDLQGATALTPDSGSNHSGGTDETIPMDDVIEYVDA